MENNIHFEGKWKMLQNVGYILNLKYKLENVALCSMHCFIVVFIYRMFEIESTNKWLNIHNAIHIESHNNSI